MTESPSPTEEQSEPSLVALNPFEWLRGLFGTSPDADGATQSSTASVTRIEGQAFVLREGQRFPLVEGDQVLVDDVLLTADSSAVEMLFADGMEFRIGADARLSIDAFIFNQQDSTGLQALSMIKGAFFYQGGALAEADPSQVQLKTPLGTLGIRGTKLLGIADTPVGECIITLLEGKVLVNGDRGGQVWLTKPLDTAKMKIEWTHVGFDAFSSQTAIDAYADLLFNGDRERTNTFIEQNKGTQNTTESTETFSSLYLPLPDSSATADSWSSDNWLTHDHTPPLYSLHSDEDSPSLIIQEADLN